MTYLAIALLAFLALHLIPAIAPLKAMLLHALGRPTYITLFASGSVLTLVMLVHARFAADYVPLYEPPAWSRRALIALMLPVCLLVGVALAKGTLARLTRLPVPLAFSAWALGHLLANGDLASVLMFGTLALYSLLILALRWPAAAASTGGTLRGDMLGLAAGFAVYLVLLLWFHPAIIGVSLVY